MILSVVHAVAAWFLSRIVWPFAAPSFLCLTVGFAARLFGVIPALMQSDADLHAPATTVGVPQASR